MPPGPDAEIAAIDAVSAATVAAARWLLGVAGAFAPILAAGIGLSRVDEVAEEPPALIMAGLAVAAAALAIVAVLRAATPVLQLPYGGLSDVLALRRLYMDEKGVWRKEWVGQHWQRVSQAIASATAGEVPDAPALHARMQQLGGHGAARAVERRRLTHVARLAVATANQQEIARRFGTLKNAFAAATLAVLGSVTLFVVVTAAPQTSPAVTEPAHVRVLPAGAGWPPSLADCELEELVGAAVAGRWPTPMVALPAQGGCPAALTGEGLIVVPVVDDALAPPSPSSPASLALDEPLPVTVFPVGETWPEALDDCTADQLTGVAVAGSWPSPMVALEGGPGGCPPRLIDTAVEALIVVPLPSVPDEG